MTEHACQRCGFHRRGSERTWPDRHPAAAVTAGLFGLVWMSMMLSIHPVAATTVLGAGVVGGAVYFAVRERRRRDALAARADYENAALAAAVQWPTSTRETAPKTRTIRAPRHVMTDYPTTPMLTRPIRRMR